MDPKLDNNTNSINNDISNQNTGDVNNGFTQTFTPGAPVVNQVEPTSVSTEPIINNAPNNNIESLEQPVVTNEQPTSVSNSVTPIQNTQVQDSAPTHYINFSQAGPQVEDNTATEPVEEPYKRREVQPFSLKEKGGTLLPSIILLVVASINEFLLAPRLFFRVIYWILEFVINHLDISSSFIFEVLIYAETVLSLAILIFAFLLFVYAVINIIRLGDFIGDFVKNLKRIIKLSLFISLVVVVLEAVLNINIAEPIMRIVTFNAATFYTTGLF